MLSIKPNIKYVCVIKSTCNVLCGTYVAFMEYIICIHNSLWCLGRPLGATRPSGGRSRVARGTLSGRRDASGAILDSSSAILAGSSALIVSNDHSGPLIIDETCT